MLESFKVIVTSLPDEEDMISEIYYDKVQWAEVRIKNNTLNVQVYHHPHLEHWEFNLESAIKALEKAKRRLLEVEGLL